MIGVSLLTYFCFLYMQIGHKHYIYCLCISLELARCSPKIHCCRYSGGIILSVDISQEPHVPKPVLKPRNTSDYITPLTSFSWSWKVFITFRSCSLQLDLNGLFWLLWYLEPNSLLIGQHSLQWSGTCSHQQPWLRLPKCPWKQSVPMWNVWFGFL